MLNILTEILIREYSDKKRYLFMRWVKQSVGYWCKDIMNGNYLGKGICVAVLDTGISGHPDLRDRIRGFRDFVGNSVKYYDDSGHGTHVAGILCGSGEMSSYSLWGDGT